MPHKKESDLFHLSVSKVKTFLTCKAKYRYQYIEHLPKIERDFQVFGSFLHEALEEFQSSIIGGVEAPDHIRMKLAFSKAMKGDWGPKLTPEQKQECIDVLKEYLVFRYNNRNAPSEVLEVEKPFSFDLDGKVLLNGFIDVVQRDADGIIHVADYKSSKEKKYLKKDLLQLKTYALALMYNDSDIDKIRCSYVMLRHKFDPIQKEFERSEIMPVADEFLEYAENINAEKLYRPSTGPLCKFCDYLGKCSEGKKYILKGDDSFGITDW